MCGIFWYKGKKSASNILLNWLQRLEYRGYDSAGIAISDKNWNIDFYKEVGKVWNLVEKVHSNLTSESENYNLGIAHTRWATHGGVTKENTHPHTDEKGNFFVVHNGIIENYEKLKKNLEEDWYNFYSNTDSEVIAKLLDKHKNKDLLKTVENILPFLEWAFAILVFSKLFPWEMVAVKYWSPLVFGYTQEWEFFFSSDIPALSGYADNFIFLDDWDVLDLKNNDYIVKSEWKLVSKSIEKINTDNLQVDKWNYQHFMMKEIAEQSKILKDVFRWRIDFENLSLNTAAFQDLDNYDFKKIVFVGCGTSYNAGWIWTRMFEDIVWMEAKVEIASEYEYKDIKVDEDTLFVFISQSWETADVIDTLKLIKSKWWKTFGIVNVVWSSISRLTDFGLFTRAGTEIWVASTKAFIAQIAVITLMTLYFGNRKWLNKGRFEKILKELNRLPDLINEVLNSKDKIKEVAKDFAKYKDFFFIWRNYQLPIAYESSLKFKEISYLHSEALSAGELKHWSLALIDKDFPTIVFAPNDLMFEKNLSSMQEIKARDWKVLIVSDKKNIDSHRFLEIPPTIQELYPFVTVVVGQLLSYFVAYELDREIDKPRNLAKSVTVK